MKGKSGFFSLALPLPQFPRIQEIALKSYAIGISHQTSKLDLVSAGTESGIKQARWNPFK